MESGSIEHHHHPPDLWQILHSPQTQDGPELQFEHYYNKYGIQYRATTLNFGASDWNDVIQRGYSWNDFESFIDQRECVYVGPFWIHNYKVQVDHTNTFMRLREMCLARNLQQTDHSDDDVKSLVLFFLKLFSLHPVRRECLILSQAKLWLSVIQNESGIMLDYLYIRQHDHLDATTLHLAAAIIKDLTLRDCSIVSTTSTPYPLAINHFTNNRLQNLQIRRTQIDVNVLASFIQESTALESFAIHSFNNRHEPHFTSDQWMALMAVCSQCQMLKTIHLEHFKVGTNAWLPGLELLMRNQNLSSILYYLNCYESDQQQTIPDSLKASRTNTIVQALMCNKNITRLNISKSEIDVATFISTVQPILRCNRLWKNIPAFCRDMDDTRGSTQLLGCLLSHRLLHEHPSFLFELVCKVNHQLSNMWHDGRHRRVLITPNKRKRDY